MARICNAALAAAALLASLLPPVSAYDNGVTWARKPPRGWTTWCTDDICGLLDYCTESEVLQVADAMVSSGLIELNYTLVLLDDCWSSTERDSSGDLTPDPARFPSGIDALVTAIHARGLYLGLYTCAGERTCKGNRTGSGGHYEEDAKRFARHNVDYIKVRLRSFSRSRARVAATSPRSGRDAAVAEAPFAADSVGVPGGGLSVACIPAHICTTPVAPLLSAPPLHPPPTHQPAAQVDNCNHPDAPPPVYYGNFSAYLNATGKPMWLATCEWGEDNPAAWAPAIAQSFRSGPDHLPLWQFNFTNGGQGVVDIIETMASIGAETGPFAWNDPDFLEGGEILTVDESRTEFAAWAMFGGPMIIATDLRNMSAWKSAMVLNAEILELNHDDLLAAGRRVAKDTTNHTQVWAKALANGDVAAMLMNYDDFSARTVTVTAADVGLPPGSSFKVRDLWAHADAGTVKAYEATLQPHANALLRLAPVAA